MKKKITKITSVLLIIFTLLTGCSEKGPKIENLEGKMAVHFINVGQGDAAIVSVNDKNMLIDSGSRSDREEFFDYIDSLKIKKFDYVISTHPHEDHMGNMSELIDKYHVENFYAPKVTHTSRTFEYMINSLKKKNLKINVMKEGTNTIDLGPGTRVTVFSPNRNSYSDLNDYSPIMKIEYGENSFMFTGDAGTKVEKDILKYNKKLQADVLKLGHHGSSTSSSEEFINKVDPSIGIISCAENNKYGHPHREIVKLMKDKDIQTFRTYEGSVIMVSDGKEIEIIK